MRAKFAYILLPLAAASFAGSACAMNASSKPMVECRVIGGEKLPAESGGADELCAAIARAAATIAPNHSFTVEVKVRGVSSMSAILTTADGKKLPEQKFSISDRGLTKGSLDRFANNLVGEVARAASR
jgi:hypothetical protein